MKQGAIIVLLMSILLVSATASAVKFNISSKTVELKTTPYITSNFNLQEKPKYSLVNKLVTTKPVDLKKLIAKPQVAITSLLIPAVSLENNNPVVFDYHFIQGAGGQVTYRANIDFNINVIVENQLTANFLVYSPTNTLLYVVPIQNPARGLNQVQLEFLSEIPGYERGIPSTGKIQVCNADSCALSNAVQVTPGRVY